MRLTSRQESQIFEASRAGIPPTRIAELIGCTEKQATEVIADYHRILAEQEAWTATVKAESAPPPPPTQGEEETARKANEGYLTYTAIPLEAALRQRADENRRLREALKRARTWIVDYDEVAAVDAALATEPASDEEPFPGSPDDMMNTVAVMRAKCEAIADGMAVSHSGMGPIEMRRKIRDAIAALKDKP